VPLEGLYRDLLDLPAGGFVATDADLNAPDDSASGVGALQSNRIWRRGLLFRGLVDEPIGIIIETVRALINGAIVAVIVDAIDLVVVGPGVICAAGG